MTATISKGTLNLRFMQNARRAEQQELEVESAETIVAKDDSCWEVSREVKNMWGITSEPSSSSLVTHEASYLPFVLSGADASGSPAQIVKLRGRRTWNKRGQEVIEELPLEDNNNSPHGSSSVARQTVHLHDHPTKTEHHPASKRLTSISSFGLGSSSSTNETKRAKSRNAKSARELVREAPSGLREIKITTATTTNNTSAPPSPAPSPSKSRKIKIDVDTPAGSPPPPPPFAPLSFLKPAGVDDPSDDVAPRRDGSRPAQQRQPADARVDGNWGRRSQNLKREREDREEPAPTAAASTADRKKRKKSGAAATAAP